MHIYLPGNSEKRSKRSKHRKKTVTTFKEIFHNSHCSHCSSCLFMRKFVPSKKPLSPRSAVFFSEYLLTATLNDNKLLKDLIYRENARLFLNWPSTRVDMFIGGSLICFLSQFYKDLAMMKITRLIVHRMCRIRCINGVRQYLSCAVKTYTLSWLISRQ